MADNPRHDEPCATTAEAVLTITNRRGLHARAAARFVKTAERFRCDLRVEKDGTEVCGTSIMGLLLLAAATGERITVRATGPEAGEAVAALTALVEGGFDEQE